MRLLSPRETDSYIRAFSFKRTTSRSRVTEFPSAPRVAVRFRGLQGWRRPPSEQIRAAPRCAARRCSSHARPPATASDRRGCTSPGTRGVRIGEVRRCDSMLRSTKIEHLAQSVVESVEQERVHAVSAEVRRARAKYARVEQCIECEATCCQKSWNFLSRSTNDTGPPTSRPSLSAPSRWSGFALPCRRLTGR